MQPYRPPPSAHSVVSTATVTHNSLNERIEKLKQAGVNFRSAYTNYRNALNEFGGENEDVPARSLPALEQVKVSHVEQETDLLEQAEQQLETLQRDESIHEDIDLAGQDKTEYQGNLPEGGVRGAQPPASASRLANIARSLSKEKSVDQRRSLTAALTLESRALTRQVRGAEGIAEKELESQGTPKIKQFPVQKTRISFENSAEETLKAVYKRQMSSLETRLEGLHLATLRTCSHNPPNSAEVIALQTEVAAQGMVLLQLQQQLPGLLESSGRPSPSLLAAPARLGTAQTVLSAALQLLSRQGSPEQPQPMPTGHSPLLQVNPLLGSNTRPAQNTIPSPIFLNNGLGPTTSSPHLGPPASTSSMQNSRGRAHIQRIPLPQFSGQVEDFWEFREVFQSLASGEYPDPALYLLQLKNCLKEDGRNMLRGITEVGEAWALLERHYGNRNAAVSTILTRLRNIKPTGASHDKLETVAQAVQQAVTSLKHVQGQDALSSDFTLIGSLAAKLPPTYLDKWDTHVAESGGSVSWDIFVRWLGKARDIAQVARDRDLNTRCLSAEEKKARGLGAGAVVTEPSREEPTKLASEDTFFTDQKVSEEKLEQAKKKAKSCPLCAQEGKEIVHYYKKDFPLWQPKAGSLMWPSTHLASCKVFTGLSPEDRSEALAKLGACYQCSSFLHNRSYCRWKPRPCGTAGPDGQLCTKRHIPELHDVHTSKLQANGVVLASPTTAAAALSSPVCTFSQDPVLLGIVHAKVKNHKDRALLLLDEGAQVSLIRNGAAKKFATGPGRPWSLRLQVVGDCFRTIPTRLYDIYLVDSSGTVRPIVAAGVEKISSAGAVPDLSSVKDVFPGILPSTLSRPQGEIDLLVGMCDAELLPFGGQRAGNLRLERCPWGGGEILRGSTTGLDLPAAPQLTPAAFSASRASLHPPPDGSTLIPLSVGHISLEPSLTPLPPFWEAEELGARPRPQCPAHQNCHGCKYALEHLSTREREVVARMEAGITVKEGRVSVSYPWLPCVSRLKDNSLQARAIQTSVEKSLIKRGLHKKFNEEMEKALEQGTFSKVSRQELDNRRRSQEPMHYVSIFGVEQPGHLGHSLRVVCDSAMKNCHSGLSVNDCLEKPPNTLVPLLDVLLWWRTNLFVLMVDLARAYQALWTGEMERYTRMFLWRRSGEEPWETYAYDRVTFGDQVAATALEIAKGKAATLGASIDQSTADQLRDKGYADDLAIAAQSREELKRVRGELEDDGTYTGSISRILACCTMAPKYIATAGEKPEGPEEKLGGKMLGVGYNCTRDVITYQFSPAYHKKGKGGHKIPVQLTTADLATLRRGEGHLTLKVCLSYLMGHYDPLGLVSPLLMKGKLLLRRTHSESGGWDKELPADIKKAWGFYITELSEAGTIIFPRATSPPGAGASIPRLAAFGDGSLEGFMGLVYVVWTMPDGESSVHLIIAKARVAPSTGTSVPRMEMSSLALLSRLSSLVVKAAGFQPVELVRAVDSECVVAAYNKREGVLKPFFAHRVAEAQESAAEVEMAGVKVPPVAAIPGEINPADIGTRGKATALDVGPSSYYQRGPEFLQGPRSSWPLKSRVCEDAPPEELKVHLVKCSLNSALAQGARESVEESRIRPVISPRTTKLLRAAWETMDYTNSLEKATRILAILVRASFLGKEEVAGKGGQISSQEFKMARALQFLASAPPSIQAHKRGELRALGGVLEKGEVWLQGRVAPDDLAVLLGTSTLRIVMPSTRLAYLVMQACHEEDHRRDPRDAMARSRRICWIPKARPLAAKVVKSCMVCRLRDKVPASQIMGELPSFKVLGMAPFLAVGLDFMGPYEVRGMCGGRRHYKCWVAVYTCFSSHATVLLATPGYDTATFMVSHTKFCNTYGVPSLVIVDPGPNLKAAAERPDWQEVASSSGWAGTSWKITPKGSPWRAGQVERMVGLAKRSMHHLLEGRAFSGDFHKLEALLSRIAWLLNSRPIAVRSLSETDFFMITPNDIILGRAARPHGDIPLPEDLEEPSTVLRSLSHMEKVARAWHTMFIKQAWPHLVSRCKWKVKRPNVAVGDLGHLLYTSKFGKPTWRPCRVLEVHPDRQGIVRTVTVGLRRRSTSDGMPSLQSTTLAELVVGVQRLAVVFTKKEQEEMMSMNGKVEQTPKDDPAGKKEDGKFPGFQGGRKQEGGAVQGRQEEVSAAPGAAQGGLAGSALEKKEEALSAPGVLRGKRAAGVQELEAVKTQGLENGLLSLNTEFVRRSRRVRNLSPDIVL
jgi:hypothetical protein